MNDIHIWGIKQNNLKNIEVRIPQNSFTVICGPSGSGKSSLAFETLYAEGQRRYIESLSNYTKQFLNKAPKPDIEGINNIPPALSIEQKNGVKSSRSTVGTTTEIYDYLRLMFEKLGHAYCPEHSIALSKDSPSSGAKKVLKLFADQRGYILSPLSADGRTGTGKTLLKQLKADGFLRVYIPAKTSVRKKKVSKKTKSVKTTEVSDPFRTTKMGKIVELDDPALQKKGLPKTDIFIVVDRLAFKGDDHGRVTDSLAMAYTTTLKYNKQFMYAKAHVLNTDGQELILSEEYSCSVCEHKFPNISSKLFSFNSPVGACETCNGFGNTLVIDEAKVIPNPRLSIAQGAIKPFTMPSGRADKRALNAFCKKQSIDVHTPWQELPGKARELIWNGCKDFYGVLGLFEYLETKKYKMHVRVFLARHKSAALCPSCKGSRLKPEAHQVFVHGHAIHELSCLPIAELDSLVKSLPFTDWEKEVCHEVLLQLQSRLGFLCDVGVGYLTLDRATKTLSGGEFQRLNLSNQLGMGLSQTLYVLDEPTIGLHPRDNERLIKVLHSLKDLGNTLVVVEHDQDVIENSSHIIEIGPGSGHLGGEIVFAGPRAEFYECEESLTVKYLQNNAGVALSTTPRPTELGDYRYFLEIKGCSGNNLKNVNLKLPLNRLVTVTGVSGSGKSSLISSTLYPALARHLGVEFVKGLDFTDIKGLDHLKNVLFIDQSPIGKTARSSPVTYLKVFDDIRKIFASTDLGKSRGYTPGTFSLNVDGGRCPVCKGLGFESIDMMFMDDIHITCDACSGKKYREEILEVKYKGRSIGDVLSMTVAEAMEFFISYPQIRRPLAILKEVGLDYIVLGQTASTLSGGESQRLKIAREFNSTAQKGTLYIMDEPTTGLHFREVHLLLKVLNRLVESGGSVIVIEHNQEIIRNSDHIIDIGPDAGHKGGKIIAQGSPEEVMKQKKSLTGQFLKSYIENMTPKNTSSQRSKNQTLEVRS